MLLANCDRPQPYGRVDPATAWRWTTRSPRRPYPASPSLLCSLFFARLRVAFIVALDSRSSLQGLRRAHRESQTATTLGPCSIVSQAINVLRARHAPGPSTTGWTKWDSSVTWVCLPLRRYLLQLKR